MEHIVTNPKPTREQYAALGKRFRRRLSRHPEFIYEAVDVSVERVDWQDGSSDESVSYLCETADGECRWIEADDLEAAS